MSCKDPMQPNNSSNFYLNLQLCCKSRKVTWDMKIKSLSNYLYAAESQRVSIFERLDSV